MKNEDHELTENEKIRLWIDAWEKAAPELEEIRRRELQEWDTNPKKWKLLDEMLDWAVKHPMKRPMTGLVEQQYWFMKLREKLEREGKLEKETKDES